jgi:hypothetical protein
MAISSAPNSLQVCAEWNFGGFPAWLKFEPNIAFRTNNTAFETAMASWMTYLTPIVRPYLASQGGPVCSHRLHQPLNSAFQVILAQVENEYGNIEAEYGAAGFAYATWAINFAQSLNYGIPW